MADRIAKIKVQIFVLRKDTADILGRRMLLCDEKYDSVKICIIFTFIIDITS